MWKGSAVMRTKIIIYAYIMSGVLILFMAMLSDVMLKNSGGSSMQSDIAKVIYAANNKPYPESGGEMTEGEITEQDISGTETGESADSGNVTENSGNDSAGGERTVAVFSHESDKITEMGLEEYLVGVVMAEMPYTYEYEALKAQAVAARSYCLYRMQNGGVSQHDNADVCTSYAHCAAYISESEAEERWGKEKAEEIREIISKAVYDTEGIIITYNQKPAAAVFHASSYRYTESAVNVWGYDIPYLVSVKTPEADDKSEVTLTLDELYSKIGGKGSRSGKKIILKSTDTGRILTLTFGDVTVNAKDLRADLGLKSCKFEISEKGNKVTFTVHGRGHGIGMSQVGANELAKNGEDYVSILMTYYTGVEIGSLR